MGVSKVVYAGKTVVDMTGATATADKILTGYSAYGANGELIEGSLSMYPVGSVYFSFESTSPAELFGGTWEQLKNRFLVGAGDTYSTGATGGADTVTLTAANLPAHSHSIGYNVVYRQTVTSGGGVRNVVNGGEASTLTGSVGSGTAHENRPPYIAVYMWKRVD